MVCQHVQHHLASHTKRVSDTLYPDALPCTLFCLPFVSVPSALQAESEEAYTAVVCQHVQHHLASHTKRVFDTPVLPSAQAYVAAVPLDFLRLLLPDVSQVLFFSLS